MSVVAAYRWLFALLGVTVAAAGFAGPTAVGAIVGGLAAAAVVSIVVVQLAHRSVPAPVRARQTMRHWERRETPLRLTDPDAPGRARPRAPSA
ncbi:MAG: hypothetical protein HOV71_03030 [Hamadaea sp.]|uniref:DUF6412 domain-containing protein n=1 Tax=Hamadaea sp. NPDC050747 TaxID=3155789 RepID=UPI00182EEDCE|nr:hypothetical protein [Hamadaea sp.]NUR47087.1 hypothetical protein [Hamadaea sp.]NUT07378.1 hypothetical protein [Hamadaea sp.]